MYVELLSAVIQNNDEPAPCGVLEDAISCRVRRYRDRPDGAQSVHNALALEVAYDRSLLRLCASKGICVAPALFDHPEAERDRLERALVTVGVDLSALTRSRTRTS